MKSSNKKEINLLPHPRNNPDFYGHDKSVEILEGILKTDRIPKSWLFCGSEGIGKATLAYRFAKCLLSGKKTLSPDNMEPAVIRVSGDTHSDLLVIEPDAEKASNEISVNQIRKISEFLRLSASETKYRIVIIDSADNMNNAAANALLKLLEEPPVKSIFLLISHCPGRLLPTIKSRCRYLNLGSLSEFHASSILQTAIPELAPHENDMLIYIANDSPGVAINLYYNNGTEIYQKILGVLKTLPTVDNVKVQELAELVTKKGDKIAWQAMTLLFDTILTRLIKATVSKSFQAKLNIDEKELLAKVMQGRSVEGLMDIKDRSNQLISDTSRIHLDKKAVIVSIFREFC